MGKKCKSEFFNAYMVAPFLFNAYMVALFLQFAKKREKTPQRTSFLQFNTGFVRCWAEKGFFPFRRER